MNKDKQELLEIYKLHAELADRVSQRREGANRLYVSLLTGVLIFLATFLRYGTGAIPVFPALATIAVFGVLLAISWYIVIRSYRQLNTGKFKALLELEKQLDYPFFTHEWEFLKRGEEIKTYWKLSVVETCLPLAFILLYTFIPAAYCIMNV